MCRVRAATAKLSCRIPSMIRVRFERLFGSKLLNVNKANKASIATDGLTTLESLNSRGAPNFLQSTAHETWRSIRRRFLARWPARLGIQRQIFATNLPEKPPVRVKFSRDPPSSSVLITQSGGNGTGVPSSFSRIILIKRAEARLGIVLAKFSLCSEDHLVHPLFNPPNVMAFTSTTCIATQTVL
jgi:hypothetical protein